MSNMPQMDDAPRMVVSDEKAREIEAKLAAISSDEPYVAPEVEAETPESDVKPDPTPVEAAVEESKPVEDAPGATPEPADKAPATDAPTLPANIRRSLKATGWTEDEILEQHTALGEQFEAIADKVHQKRMDESREWAARGRMVTATEPTEVAPQDAPSELSAIDVAALKEKYGHDPDMAALIDEMSKPFNEAVETLRQIMPELAEQRAHQAQATETATRGEVESFFGSGELSTYEGFYGKGAMEDLTNTEFFNNRMSVLQYADALQVGASAQGRSISMSEALGMAHDSVSGDFRMEALRDKIKTTMQQRAKSVTLKPDSSGGSPNATPEPGAERPEKTRAQMEADATIALRKVFG